LAKKEYRKLQKVGRATYSITLPKRWVAERGLRQGDLLLVAEEADGSIRVQPPSAAPLQVTCTINAELCRSPGLLSRLLIGCYHQGYESVRVVAASGLTREQLREVAETVDRLPGFEIVEQTYRRVVMQSFIDPAKIPLEGLLKRLQVMVAAMLNNFMEFVETGRQDLLDTMRELELKVDELYFLILRLILLYLKRRELGEPLGIDSPAFASGARVVAKSLEEMADQLAGVADELTAARRRSIKLDGEVCKRLRKLAEMVHTVFGKSMKAFFSLDMELANEVIEGVNYIFRHHGKNVAEPCEADNPKLVQTIRYVSWSLGYVARSCKVIAEVALNRFVRSSTSICSLGSFSSSSLR